MNQFISYDSKSKNNKGSMISFIILEVISWQKTLEKLQTAKVFTS